MTALTLADFLRARIAEDETTARHPDLDGGFAPLRVVADDIESSRTGYHLAVSPGRILAECEAKRRIVELERIGLVLPQAVFALLALPYAGHPDYREEWRP